MNELSHRTKIIIAFFVMVVGGSILTYLASFSGGVSASFIEARMQGALISQSIVDLSKKSASSLEEINRLDRSGSYGKALEMTNQLIAQNREIKEKALALSRELETMTKSLDSISPESARTEALQSITSRLAMITRLVSYSDSLAQLLETLKLRFSGVSYGQTQAINKLIAQINSEVVAINNFDQEAQKAMNNFDAIIGQRK